MPLRTLLLILVVVVGCARAGADPRAPRTARAPLVADPLAPPWRVTDVERTRAQRVFITSVLTSQVDTFVRVDTLASVLEASWSPVPETTTPRTAGMVTVFGVRAPRDSTWRLPAGVTLPFSFVAVGQDPGAIPRITTPDASACGASNAVAIQAWREAWMALPAELAPGDRWQDSTSYVLCRDSIPLTVNTVRRFEVLGSSLRGEQQVVEVVRRSSTTLAGEGRQFGEQLRLEGEGEGVVTFAVTLAGGIIVAGEGSSELRMTLTGRRRMQRVVQESRVRIDAP